VKRAFSLGCALLAVALAACQQTVVLDDLPPDAGRTGTGGAGGNGSGKGGSGPSDASTDGRCFGNQQPLQYTPDQPQIVVALDRSTAMNETFGMNGQTPVMVALNAIDAELSNYDGHNGRPSIQFYFLDFPDTAGDCTSAMGCCPSDVTGSFNDFEQQANACHSPGPNNCLQSTNRPTAAALSKAQSFFMFSDGPQHGNERYVLLITDDDPGGACASSNGACSDALDALKGLTAMGVTTEVVDLGSDGPCLNDLANAQGVFPSPYYLTSTPPTDLPDLIDSITSDVAQDACRLTLASPPTSGSLAVTYGGVLQQQDSGTTGNGWHYDGKASVFLHGSLCQNFLHNSQGSFGGLQLYDGCLADHLGGNP
jgi:hypothetical protein